MGNGSRQSESLKENNMDNKNCANCRMQYRGKVSKETIGTKLSVKVVDGKALLESEKLTVLYKRRMCLVSKTPTLSDCVCSFWKAVKA
jgi:hypothetical protein